MAHGDFQVFRSISKIIERDSKSTTYKFALLRGTIDIIIENSPFIRISEDRAHIPVGLMMERWMVYYYSILESEITIPQINGSANLAFAPQLQVIVEYYRAKGGFSAFYNDLRHKHLPNDLRDRFLTLNQKIRDTIVNMPMKYLGRSISQDFYSVYRKEGQPRSWRSATLDYSGMITHNGWFSIPLEYYKAFQVLGSFIGGQDSILFKWAEFSVNADRQLTIETVLRNVLRSPVTERDVAESKRLYKEMLSGEGTVPCVWTGASVMRYDIDHVIPFSIWKNNDLWNLLPSSDKVNKAKRDMIPSPEMIEKSKERIIIYWNRINETYPERFHKELHVSLLGGIPGNNWQQIAIDQLQQNCRYLIDDRGYEPWST